MTDDVTDPMSLPPKYSADPLPPPTGRMQLSYSQVGAYTGCPRKWALSKTYEKTEPSIPLVLGSWWHAVRAAYNITQGTADGTLLEGMAPEELKVKTWWGEDDIPLDAGVGVVGVLMAAKEHWEAHEASLTAPVFEERFVEKHGAPLHVYLKHLTLMWDVYKPRDLGPVLGVEVPLAIDLEGPSGPVRVIGFVDLIDQGPFGPRVLDLKTSDYVPTGTSRAVYEQQLSTYCYAWSRAMAEEEGTGPLTQLGPVTEVGYEYVATHKPGVPKLTLKGALSATPKYPLSTYLSWVRTEGVPQDEKEVKKLSSPDVAAKWVVLSTRMVNRHLVDSHIQSIVDVSEEMRRTWERWQADGVATPHLAESCTWCPFWGLCADQVEGYGIQDMRKIDDTTLDSMKLKRKGRSKR